MADQHVTLDERRFIVKRDAGGRVRAIYERKIHMPGTPMAALYDRSIWHRNHNRSKSDKTLPARILAAIGEALP